MEDEAGVELREDNGMQLSYMVIESFSCENVDAIYGRFAERGRLLPEGLEYIDSWLAADQTRCFQLMRTDKPELFEQWFAQWDDLVAFEVVELGEKPV